MIPIATAIEAAVIEQFVAGEWRSGRGETPVVSVNPARPDHVVGVGSSASRDDVGLAVGAALAAQPAWARNTSRVRSDAMLSIAVEIERTADELAELVCLEVGKPIAESRAEVQRAADIFRYFAGQATRPVGSLYASAERDEHIETTRRPVGVVGVITPFNFPVALPAWKLAAALVHGNGVIWKASEAAPASAQRLMSIMLRAELPPDVTALIHGGRETGQALITDPRIRALSFTGSTAVGRTLIAAAGERALPLQAEMGGSNAAIVLPDADLDLAAAEIVSGGFSSCGQRCTSTSRVVCDSNIYEALVERLTAAIAEWTTGDPARPEVRVGPVISAAARNRLRQAAARALEGGGELVTSGALHESASTNGFFVQPQLIHVRDLSSELWTEEVFGPVMAITAVSSRYAAIEAARHAQFGLSAAVFTSSLEAAREVDRALDVGVMHVNSATTGAAPHVPFGGVNGSGFGPMEQGAAAVDFYTKRRTTYIRSAA